MSLKVHPDRCKHEKAEEAFNGEFTVVSKDIIVECQKIKMIFNDLTTFLFEAMKRALTELENPEKRKAYADMIRKVKEKIRQELKKEKFRWELVRSRLH